MNIIVNGAPTEIADDSRLSDLVEALALGGQRFAVEVNAELVPRSRLHLRPLEPEDRVEIIHAVGGG